MNRQHPQSQVHVVTTLDVRARATSSVASHPKVILLPQARRRIRSEKRTGASTTAKATTTSSCRVSGIESTTIRTRETTMSPLPQCDLAPRSLLHHCVSYLLKAGNVGAEIVVRLGAVSEVRGKDDAGEEDRDEDDRTGTRVF